MEQAGFTYEQIAEALRQFMRDSNLAQRPNVERHVVFAAAARGDHDAQVAVAHSILAEAECGAMCPCEAAAQAECLARLAAVSDEPQHLQVLAAILLLRAEHMAWESVACRKAGYEGEALFLLDRAAAAGDEDAELQLQLLSDRISPEGAAHAARLNKQVRG